MLVRFRSPAPRGRIPEWPKGADCKSVVSAFGGSNPPPPTNKNLNRTVRLRFLFVEGMVDEPCAQMYADCVVRRLSYCLIFAGNSPVRAGSAACTTRRFRLFLPARDKTQRTPKPYPFNALHLWRTHTSSHQENRTVKCGFLFVDGDGFLPVADALFLPA